MIISLQPVDCVFDIRDEEATTVQGLSISQSGASFLFPGDINEKGLLLGLTVSKQITWFYSEIVRKKRLPDADYWEYGVKFLRKVNS